MRLKTIIQRGIHSKSIWTGPKVYNAETLNITKRDDYYKNLWVQDDSKPPGWEDALPYEAIPGPKPIPVLGNMWRFFPYVGDYYNIPLQKMHQMLHEQYGNVVSFKGIIGRKPMVMLFDVNDMEIFLRNAGPFPIRRGMGSFVYYRTKLRNDIFQGVGGVLTVQGEDWFKFRSLVNPIMMQPRTAQQYVGSMDVIANKLIRNMEYLSARNENNEMPENFINELYKWSLESIGVIALNKHLGCLNLDLAEESEPRQFVTHVVEMFELMYKMDVMPPVWKLISTPSWKRYIKVLDFLTETAMKYINEALAEKADANVPDHELGVLQRLVKIDKKVAVAMIVDMLIAGVDTTGRVLGAALYFLARHPEKQKCLREEVLEKLPEKHSPVTNNILSKSPYLKAVIKETTRLSPVAVGQLRTTVKDLVLGGYRIPKNWFLPGLAAVGQLERRFGDHAVSFFRRYSKSYLRICSEEAASIISETSSRIDQPREYPEETPIKITEVVSGHLVTSFSEKFKDAEKFIPERYLRSADDEYSYKNVHQFASLPFGFGARSCVGKRFANLELEVSLCKIIRNFELSRHHEDMKFSAKFLYGIASPLKLRVQPLNN